MKFGKSLSNQIEESLPEWKDKFLSYKELKKRLKLIGGGTGEQRLAKRARAADDEEDDDVAASITKEEEDFIKLLEDELEKFNAFFVEKEEEYIIRQKDLQDIVAKVVVNESKDDLMKVRKEIVDFHGEMVLLENYSALNYTGLVKILKKYDKRTGALMRFPFIQKVLQQPFFTTDLIYKLVRECETMLECLFHSKEPSVSRISGEKISGEQKITNPGSSSLCKGGQVLELEDIEYMKSLYMKSTVAALRALKEIRSGSSTVSVFSLPPLQSNGSNVKEDLWIVNNTQVLEQVAE